MPKESKKDPFIKLIHDLDEADGKADGRIIATEKMHQILDIMVLQLGEKDAQLIMQINQENQRNNGFSPEKPRAKSIEETQQEQRADNDRQQNLQQLYTDLNSTNKYLHFVSALESHLFKDNQPDGAGYRISCPDTTLQEKLKNGDFAAVLSQCIPQEGVPSTPAPAVKKAPRKR